jgi:caffeoyl-CoA O-methyltransferase
VSNKTINMTEELHHYLLSVSLREPEILQRLREETASDSMAHMQIAPEQGQFMALLVQLMGARKTIDVGVYTGYSALCVAKALPPGGKVVACDVSREWTRTALRYWTEAGVYDMIDLQLAPALQTLDKLIARGEVGTFDFIFIDADKENYNAYYERSLTLLRRGGLIAVDNVLWDGRVADQECQDLETDAIRRLNKKLFQDDRISLSMVPIADGLTLAYKRHT